MLFSDTYRTINLPSVGTYKDRGSKFLSFAYPLIKEEEFKDHLNLLRTEHGKANHFCWALRVGADRTMFKLNDDGEPSGTAGRPILNTLLSADLTNILIVVVRYFGGTLLGVPGLINAYKAAALDAVQAPEIVERTTNDSYLVEFNYLQMNEVMKILKEENLKISNQEYDNTCWLEVSIRQSQTNQIISKLEKVEQIKIKYLQSS